MRTGRDAQRRCARLEEPDLMGSCSKRAVKRCGMNKSLYTQNLRTGVLSVDDQARFV